MDQFGPTGKVSKKRVHLLRWSSVFGRTGLNFGQMNRAPNPDFRNKKRTLSFLGQIQKQIMNQ